MKKLSNPGSHIHDSDISSQSLSWSMPVENKREFAKKKKNWSKLIHLMILEFIWSSGKT